MSWDTLIVLVLLFLPVLQALMEGRKPQPPAPPPEAQTDGEPVLRPTLPHEAQTGDGPVLRPAPWQERTHGAAPRPAAEPPPLPRGREARPLPPGPQEAPAASETASLEARPRHRPRPEDPPALETVSLEPLTSREVSVELPQGDAVPDREAEHARFHRRVAQSAPAPRRPRGPAIRLQGVDEVRRAVLLAEILGPPRALRPLEPEDS